MVIEADPEGVPWVRLDTEGGTDAAMEHLIGLGHRRIGRVGSSMEFPTFELRAARYRAALERIGGEPLFAGSLFDFDDAARAAGELLDLPEPPTAIICDDDILAGGVYLAARERGVRIPDDLSVVGFDDLDFAHVLDAAADHGARRGRAPRRGRVRDAGRRDQRASRASRARSSPSSSSSASRPPRLAERRRGSVREALAS